MIRIFHVDDLADIRAGFAAVVRTDKELSLVASVGTVQEALEALAAGVEFEVAVVDLGLPDGSGLEVIRAIRKARPLATPIAFSIFDDPDHIFDALRAGACGYLLKHTTPARMVESLREVANGGATLSAAIARKVVATFTLPPPAQEASPLTSREQEVLERLVRGDTYGQVAQHLGVSLSTVQSHVRAVYSKLEVTSKAEATRQAIRKGFVTP